MAVLAPEFLQTKTYTAQRVRAMLSDMTLQPGVMGATDFRVAGTSPSGLSVRVQPGSAWVRGSIFARQGNYHCYNDGIVDLPVNSNATGLPRIDQVVLHVYDTFDGGDAQDNAFLEVIPGTATSGATLVNRLGAATLPNNCLLLSDVLVPSGAVSLGELAGHFQDRRAWARGAYRSVIRTAASNPTTSDAANWQFLDLANWNFRLELTGVPVRMRLDGWLGFSLADSNRLMLNVATTNANTGTGVAVANNVIGQAKMDHVSVATGIHSASYTWDWTPPSAGSWWVAPVWIVNVSGTITLFNTAQVGTIQNQPVFTVEEIVRQNSSNVNG